VGAELILRKVLQQELQTKVLRLCIAEQVLAGALFVLVIH
jgi:hypothetical protein